MVIRPATTNDVSDIANLHIKGWQAAYGGLVDQAYLDSLRPEERQKDWEKWMEAGETTTLLAERDGRAAGFVTYGRTKTAPPGDSNIRPQYPGEIYALYLDADMWRQGIGRALMQAAFQGLSDQKMKGACLWVLDGNRRAKAFYEALGGQRIGKKMITIGPSQLKEICYGWRDLKNFAGK